MEAEPVDGFLDGVTPGALALVVSSDAEEGEGCQGSDSDPVLRKTDAVTFSAGGILLTVAIESPGRPAAVDILMAGEPVECSVDGALGRFRPTMEGECAAAVTGAFTDHRDLGGKIPPGDPGEFLFDLV